MNNRRHHTKTHRQRKHAHFSGWLPSLDIPTAQELHSIIQAHIANRGGAL